MSEEVKFTHANNRISQLAQRPDIAAEVAQARAEMGIARPGLAAGRRAGPGARLR